MDRRVAWPPPAAASPARLDGHGKLQRYETGSRARFYTAATSGWTAGSKCPRPTHMVKSAWVLSTSTSCYAAGRRAHTVIIAGISQVKSGFSSNVK